MRTPALTIAALVCFAANSLLCRAALRTGDVDAATFALIRFASGAIALALLARALGGAATAAAAPPRVPTLAPAGRDARRARWAGAVALAAYAVPFSFAYLRLHAATGALALFGAVQATMIAWGLRRGERPHAREWLGLGAALAGLSVLALPGLSAPDPLGLGLMTLAGVAWGVYSLLGRSSLRPLEDNAERFALALPLLALALAASWRAGAVHVSARGLALALASGVVATGLGYAAWYAALRWLTATRAAIAQLSVPAIAAFGAVPLLREPLDARVALAGTIILGGVGLAVRRGAAAAARSEPDVLAEKERDRGAHEKHEHEQRDDQ